MKKINLKTTIAVIIITFGYLVATGQNTNLKSVGEQIKFFTDRTLYITGEKIQFAAYVNILGNESKGASNKRFELNDSQNCLSNIIYVELITPDGEKITGEKFLIEKSFRSGCLPIPKEIVTGIYYLRAYTKYMRNDGPNSYSYLALKVVNPYKSDILSYKPIEPSLLNDSIKMEDSTVGRDLVTILLDKQEYTTREGVKIQIKGSESIRDLNVSVIPSSSIVEGNKIQLQSEKTPTSSFYFPETNGISLTGKLMESKSDKFLTNTKVNLSILGDSKDFMAVLTDSTGRFFFKMPNFKGVRDVFLCTETMVDSKSTILIDNDFCRNKINIPTPIFKMTEAEKEIAYNMALNAQIASHFNTQISKDSVRIDSKAFYDEPQEKLVLDKYIQLPTLEDYINEIIPTLKVRKHQGRKYFKIFSAQTEMEIYKPLVLLDLVAIDNPEKILSLSPQSISHIEVVNVPYIKGNITYGGIVSIFSKKGDFAGIDLPSSGIFLDYKFFSDCTITGNGESPTMNQPDCRNTLFWEPNISLNSANPVELSFKTADTPGKYTVLLRGLTDNGKLVSLKKSFVVQAKN